MTASTALKRGRARPLELAEQRAHRRDEIAASLLARLPNPTAYQQVVIHNAASSLVRAERYEAIGQDDNALRLRHDAELTLAKYLHKTVEAAR